MAGQPKPPEAVLLSDFNTETENDATTRREVRQLNLAAVATAGFTVMILLLSMVWNADHSFDEGDSLNEDWWSVPLEDRWLMDLNMTGERSQLPEKGPYNWTGPSEYFVEVDLPASEQDAGFPGPALMHIALWMPNVPDGTTVPVIATIHPYYDFGGKELLVMTLIQTLFLIEE